MANLGKFKISSSSAYDHVIMNAVQFELHVFSAIFGGMLLAFQQRIEQCLVIVHLKDSRGIAADRRETGGISGARAGIEVRQKRGAIDTRFVERHSVLNASKGQVAAVLQRQSYGLPH